jgi:hypothetical protein
MFRLNRVVCVSVAMAGLAAHAAPARADKALDAALQSLTPDAIRAHMQFLADDLLEGRGTGTRGYRLAAGYVAAQLQRCGLEPMGDAGTYFQWLDLRETVQEESGCAITLVGPDGEQALEYAQHFLMDGHAVEASIELTAPLVYVGYGVSAPDVGYDDYAGVDVRGKVIVFMRGAPPTFQHNQRAYYASSRLKRENAVARGAVGTLTFLPAKEAAKRPWSRSVMNSKLPSMRVLDPAGQPLAAFPELRVDATLSEAGVAAVFAGAPHGLADVHAAAEAGRPQSFDLALTGRFRVQSRHVAARCANVVAFLPGSDAVLRDEVLVYSAHLDHLGIGEPLDGDRIYNGAFDNTSGIAVMLEVARAFAEMPRAPRRSIVFLAVTAEEKGLLGSEYFAAHPTVPLSSIVANVNLDMFLMLHPLHDIIAFGEEHSTLSRPVANACKRLGIEMTPDPMPEEVIFIRSDQYSFVRQGVPAVFLVAGFKGHSARPQGMSSEQWLTDVYHTQKDDLSQYMDLDAGVRFAQANLLIGHEIANAKERPRWNPGDFFGERFAKPRVEP